MNNFLIKLKEKIFPINKLKLFSFVFTSVFVIYSYMINMQIDHKGFLFFNIFFFSSIFSFIIFTLVFIRHYIANFIFVFFIILWIVWINFVCGTFDYIYNTIKDSCYKRDYAPYIGKGPWEYNLGNRKCVGKRYMGGDIIIYKTEN